MRAFSSGMGNSKKKLNLRRETLMALTETDLGEVRGGGIVATKCTYANTGCSTTSYTKCTQLNQCMYEK